MISAEIIADSLNEHGQRLTTFVLVFPRIVLAEFNTHRMISRNSASSRAIPFERMLEKVKTNPFKPIKWMKDHPGMQGNEYLSDKEDIVLAEASWHQAKESAIEAATNLSNAGVTKQFCNRLLEPFMWHTVIATATDWENFFSLRAHPAAEIHIQELAHKMLDAYNASVPNQLKAGEWHIPFGDKIDVARLIELPFELTKISSTGLNLKEKVSEAKLKIATARCARISYNTFEGKDDYEADIKLHDRLAASGHWSPFEHCAKAMTESEYDRLGYGLSGDTVGSMPYLSEPGWCGNFRGFVQYRKLFQGENRNDPRVVKKKDGTRNNTGLSKALNPAHS